MSKKSSVVKPKKSRRRLKRSVRRTLAAVLMITAIGVAAVPVPENMATTSTPGGVTPNTVVVGDVHNMDGFGYKQTSSNESDKLTTDDAKVSIGNKEDIKILGTKDGRLDWFADSDVVDLFTTPGVKEDQGDSGTIIGSTKPELYASYKIENKILTWEFLYYIIPAGTNIGGVICKYNDTYSDAELTIGERLNTKYYQVSQADFAAMYNKDERPATGYDTTLKTFKIDPTETIKFTYDEYNGNATKIKYEDYIGDPTLIPNGFDENAWKFLTGYYKDYLKAACENFDKYDDEAKKWLDDNTDKTDNDLPDEIKALKTDLTVVPADYLRNSGLLEKFYCENINNFPGTGFTLDSIHVEIPGKSGQQVYVPKGGIADETKDYYTDKNEYLVKQTERRMIAIGDRAFYQVTNVRNVTLPTNSILYIGNEAFMGSQVIQKINTGDVKKIGNRAFKNCKTLTEVTMPDGNANAIGAECFYGTKVSSITLPSSIAEIGYGAFADCGELTAVDFSKLERCAISDYAFYDCGKLKKVDMTNAVVTSIGVGAFAASTAGILEEFIFPQGGTDSMTATDSIGDYMFAGRSSLKSVVFPKLYGNMAQRATKLPDNMFHGCLDLEYVEFPVSSSDRWAGAFVKYDPKKLFADVRGEKLYVRGPAQQNGSPVNGEYTAYPRISTWDAVTAKNGYKVPYLFIDPETGKECYEVSDGKYLLCIEKNEDGQTGTLVSCRFKPGSSGNNIDLEIPAMLGTTRVTAIASGCFSDEELNKEVVSLTISDNSVSVINDGVFQGWPKLAKVYIGNSVTAIGKEAFANCTNLLDVTFNTPLNGNYQGFTIGADAFKTESGKLTFHGDIVKGYAPFDWAMNPGNVIKNPEGIRVCYKSLSPTYLTVMYNPNTGLVTLLDYPKYNKVSKMLNEAHESDFYATDEDGKKVKIYSSYEDMMEKVTYSAYEDSWYNGRREAFLNRWESAGTQTEKDEIYASDDYGPWISANFCRTPNDPKWVGGGTGDVTGGDNPGTDPDNPSAMNILTDWLFEPIVAYASSGGAIDAITPYYDYTYRNEEGRLVSNHYDVIKYSETQPSERKEWERITDDALNLINATKEIVVPAGVDSIDVKGYYDNLDINGNELDVPKGDNRQNALQYLTGRDGSWDDDIIKMYTIESVKDEDNINSVPGLFSGDLDDKCSADTETRKRGNDRVISITLNSVKYLPDYAFDSCEQLSTVILGPDCADIGTAPFRGCGMLKTVGDNDYYKTNNGIVYSVNPDGSYTIEECLSGRGRKGIVGDALVSPSTDENLTNVSSIKAGAFEDCDYITKVYLNDLPRLTEIPKDCFKNCDALNTVWLHANITTIDEGAFAGANRLTELQIPGKEVFIAGDAFAADKDKEVTTVYTSEDSSARRYVNTYGERYKLEWQKKDNWRVVFLDADLNQIGDEQVVANEGYAKIPPDPVKADWIFERWVGTNNADPKDPIMADTTFIARGYSTSSMVDGKFVVDFMDQIDGKIFSTQLVEPGKDAIIPQAPVHAGYTFLKYGGDPLTNIQKNSVALAMYSGGTGTNPGGTVGTTSGLSTSTSSSTSGSTGSTSSTSTTSAAAEAAGKYTVTVINGSGSGTYDAGTTVIIAANTPATGKVFKNWTTESAGVTLASVSLSATTFIMPANNVTVTANYVTGSAAALTGTSTNGNTGNNGNNGGTRVDITKPGISNKDLATAKVNGSTDDFVVKISETPEATQAVMNALTDKYGSLDSILYYAMDISLYDSTGAVKISDTTGLTVDITIPIPDALTVFGGNNMAGAVVADRLEDLGVRFSTINGVPCISFTATHFSPYTIYVNTQQLSDGALDITPKTGDPIHPKWFLSLGLACLSIILFMKKDKKPVKAKAA